MYINRACIYVAKEVRSLFKFHVLRTIISFWMVFRRTWNSSRWCQFFCHLHIYIYTHTHKLDWNCKDVTVHHDNLRFRLICHIQCHALTLVHTLYKGLEWYISMTRIVKSRKWRVRIIKINPGRFLWWHCLQEFLQFVVITLYRLL